MAQARQRAEWGRAASILAMIHNVHCSKDRDMLAPADFMPRATSDSSINKKPPPPTAEERELLRKVFPGKKQG